jgi:hypothetical protein
VRGLEDEEAAELWWGKRRPCPSTAGDRSWPIALVRKSRRSRRLLEERRR